MPRLAIINKEKCKPDRCGFACHKVCPVVMGGAEECIEIENKRAKIDEELCSGCGICPKACPYDAIKIINLPESLNKPPINQYGTNGFRIFNLPIVQQNSITGLIGRNGIGKSTVINILSGLMKANFGEEDKPSEEEYYSKLNTVFKGTVLQSFFDRLRKNEIKVSYKPQHILQISKQFKGKVIELLSKIGTKENIDRLAEELFITNILNRDISALSGGELQRVALAACLLKEDTNFYVFDEISNYLDVYQRLNSCKVILDEVKDNTALVVEHDLVILDYLTDYVNIMYGEPSAYGMLTGIKSSKSGINDYLEGYSKEENVRFRDKPIVFDKDSITGERRDIDLTSWGKNTITLGEFSLKINPGILRQGEVLGIIGRNALGKTTMIKYIAENGFGDEKLSISYKQQLIPTNDNTVMEELVQYEAYTDTIYQLYVLEPLNIKPLLEKKVDELSGGELQRFSIAKTLLQDSDIYLLDEPTAFLDIEERLKVAKIIKNFIELKKKSAMIIDHDLVFMDYLSDRLLVFQGTPSLKGEVLSPLNMKDGMNLFLKELGITFRRDEFNKRPRVNKIGSVKDKEQKRSNEYYYA